MQTKLIKYCVDLLPGPQAGFKVWGIAKYILGGTISALIICLKQT